MTIKKAIEIKETYIKGDEAVDHYELLEADRLSIEAMKVLRHGRLIGAHYDPALLPGETKE